MKKKIASILVILLTVIIFMLINMSKVLLKEETSIETIAKEIDNDKKISYNNNFELMNSMSLTEKEKFLMNIYLSKLNSNDYIKAMALLSEPSKTAIYEFKVLIKKKLLSEDYLQIEKIIKNIEVD